MSNKLLVFTAPSGAGKTTIVHHLLNHYPDHLAFSTSATTRAARSGEQDGKDYYFLSADEFRQRITAGDFLEWEEVYPDKYYGTLRSEVERLWEEGKCVVFDIDVKGAQNIKSSFPEECLTVFIKPPSFQSLVDRLEARRTEDEQSFRTRINKAKEELLYSDNFDEILVNDVLEDTFQQAEVMVESFLGKKS
ncbi:MAG: guanylate kinase [Bacteroidota bacterium]